MEAEDGTYKTSEMPLLPKLKEDDVEVKRQTVNLLPELKGDDDEMEKENTFNLEDFDLGGISETSEMSLVHEQEFSEYKEKFEEKLDKERRESLTRKSSFNLDEFGLGDRSNDEELDELMMKRLFRSSKIFDKEEGKLAMSESDEDYDFTVDVTGKEKEENKMDVERTPPVVDETENESKMDVDEETLKMKEKIPVMNNEEVLQISHEIIKETEKDVLNVFEDNPFEIDEGNGLNSLIRQSQNLLQAEGKEIERDVALEETGEEDRPFFEEKEKKEGVFREKMVEDDAKISNFDEIRDVLSNVMMDSLSPQKRTPLEIDNDETKGDEIVETSDDDVEIKKSEEDDDDDDWDFPIVDDTNFVPREKPDTERRKNVEEDYEINEEGEEEGEEEEGEEEEGEDEDFSSFGLLKKCVKNVLYVESSDEEIFSRTVIFFSDQIPFGIIIEDQEGIEEFSVYKVTFDDDVKKFLPHIDDMVERSEKIFMSTVEDNEYQSLRQVEIDGMDEFRSGSESDSPRTPDGMMSLLNILEMEERGDSNNDDENLLNRDLFGVNKGTDELFNDADDEEEEGEEERDEKKSDTSFLKEFRGDKSENDRFYRNIYNNDGFGKDDGFGYREKPYFGVSDVSPSLGEFLDPAVQKEVFARSNREFLKKKEPDVIELSSEEEDAPPQEEEIARNSLDLAKQISKREYEEELDKRRKDEEDDMERTTSEEQSSGSESDSSSSEEEVVRKRAMPGLSFDNIIRITNTDTENRREEERRRLVIPIPKKLQEVDVALERKDIIEKPNLIPLTFPTMENRVVYPKVVEREDLEEAITPVDQSFTLNEFPRKKRSPVKFSKYPTRDFNRYDFNSNFFSMNNVSKKSVIPNSLNVFPNFPDRLENEEEKQFKALFKSKSYVSKNLPFGEDFAEQIGEVGGNLWYLRKRKADDDWEVSKKKRRKIGE